MAIEVDGFHYHKEGTQQHERDKMKNRILHAYSIPFLRFATNGSGEIAQVKQALSAYEMRRNLKDTTPLFKNTTEASAQMAI